MVARLPIANVNSCHLFAQGQRITSSLHSIEDFAFAELHIGDDASARVACSWNFHAGRDAIIEVYLHGSKAGAA